MADPSQMTDEELNKVIETGIEPEEPEVQEPVETPEEPTEEVEPAEPEEEEPQEEVANEEPEEKAPSRREQLRIQQLLAKYGDPTERTSQSAPLKQTQQLDYSQSLDADPEVIAQLEADRRAAAEAAYQQGRQEADKTLQTIQYTQFYNNIRFDLPVVEKILSKLDPIDARAIDEEYLAITGADPNSGTVRNPNIGYADFVEARVEQAERLAKSMNAQSVKNIAKQAAATGLRPDGGSAKRLNLNKAPQDMTDEELYAAIGNVGKPLK